MEMSPAPGDLRRKLSSLLRLHDTAAREKGISLRLHVAPSVPSRLVFDPVRIRRRVRNPVSIAIKFTHAGDVLTVLTSAENDDGNYTLTVHVSDTGCGIDPAKLDRIFEPLAQEDGSITRKLGGSGLGLSITCKPARMMAGDITVISEPGRRSICTLKFQSEPSAAAQGAKASRLFGLPAQRRLGGQADRLTGAGGGYEWHQPPGGALLPRISRHFHRLGRGRA